MKTLRNELINPGGNTPEKWVKSFMNRPKNMPDYAATEEEAWNNTCSRCSKMNWIRKMKKRRNKV